ncbi:MAG: pilus assembly PilX family protein [Actinomycetota bacterium]
MNPAIHRPLRKTRSEQGSAMIMALFMMVVLTGLGTVMFNIATSNQQDSGRDRLAGGALGVAEAGVAQALAFMRTNGVSTLTCDGPNPASALCGNDWGYNFVSAASGGHVVNLTGGGQYRVWIQRLAGYAPNAGVTTGSYKIFSVGTLGAGPASRTITTQVSVKPFSFPIGIFAEDYVQHGGNVDVASISMFSKGCVFKRDRVTFSGAIDLAHPGLKPGVHSAKWISTANGNNDASCSSTSIKNIHKPPIPGVCNATYPYDQDKLGGPLTALNAACYPNLTTSHFDENALKTYGYVDPRGLPANQYAELKATAQAAGTYYNCSSGPACSPNLNGVSNPNAVLYVHLGAPGTNTGRSVTFGPGDLVGYGAAYCGTRSLLIVVEGGDLHMNNNLDIVGAIFAPDGFVHVNGGAKILGSLFAKQLQVNGDAAFTLMGPANNDHCFFDNPPAGTLNVSPFNFQEVDR